MAKAFQADARERLLQRADEAIYARRNTAVELERGIIFRGEQDHWQCEKRYLRKEGDSVWVIVTGSLIRDESGRPLRTVATIIDITGRKRAEEALLEADRAKDAFLSMLVA